jgi:hypothetical protein
MKIVKHIKVKGLLALTLALMFSGTALAGSGPEPVPPGATITGPEIWGVVVINCSATPKYITLRVKRVVECNTETEAQATDQTSWLQNCPTSAAQIEGQALPGTTFFGLPGSAFFNKVKNFQNANGIVSFDAQFKFYQ